MISQLTSNQMTEGFELIASLPPHLQGAREGIQQHALARGLPQVAGHVTQQHGSVGADGGLLIHLRAECHTVEDCIIDWL